MQFGNWLINEEGISYKGDEHNSFVVPIKELTATTEPLGGKPPMYHWILEATDEEWLSHDDLYDLNYAFVWAAARFDLSFEYSVLDDTLAEQYDRFEFDEDDE